MAKSEAERMGRKFMLGGMIGGLFLGYNVCTIHLQCKYKVTKVTKEVVFDIEPRQSEKLIHLSEQRIFFFSWRSF